MLPEDLQHLASEFVGRSNELETLEEMLRQAGPVTSSLLESAAQKSSRCRCIVVYGGHNSGKSSVIRAFFESSGHNLALIDCKKCVSTRSLYEYTIDQICRNKLTVDENGNLVNDGVSIESLDAFVLQLERVLVPEDKHDKVILFDHFSHAVHDNATHFMSVIIDSLEHMAGDQTAVFIISNYEDVPCLPVPVIRFQPYTPEEICQILQAAGPPAISLLDSNIDGEAELKDMWDRFCKTIYQSFHEIVGNDIELYRTIARKIFPQYIQPVKDNILSAKSHVQLTRSAQNLFLPEPWIIAEDSVSSVLASTSREKAHIRELSASSRYLLVAAFLASYNPGKTDRTFFSRGKGEKTRRRGGKNAANKVTKQPQRLLGPKGFTLERMVSIFHAIIPMSLLHTAQLDQQLGALFSLKLLIRQGNASDLLDDGKWVINLGYDTINKIAQSVEFELNRFLVSE